MRAVAADHHPAVPEPVGDEAAADPVLVGEHFIVERVVHAQDGADRRIAIDHGEILLMFVEIVVDQPRFAPVDRDGVARPARVER